MTKKTNNRQNHKAKSCLTGNLIKRDECLTRFIKEKREKSYSEKYEQAYI